MQSKAIDPVQDISFGTALNISLDNYYDLLKTQVGGLAADEFLQLKLVADPVDINNDDASKGGYRWWSYWNLLNRSDLAISPTPVANQVQTSAVKLHETYGDLLDHLIKYVAYVNLSPGDQLALANITKTISSLKELNQKLSEEDWAHWKKYADIRGYSYGDQGQYANWAANNGNSGEIQSNNAQIRQSLLQRKVLLNKQYPDLEDKKICEASAAFDNLFMQIGYPVSPDYMYSDGGQFTLEYLSQRAGSSTGLFDSRRVLSWDKTLDTISKTTAGEFTATFDKTTQKSTSITQDWGASGSASYGLISARANANSHTQIQEDFSKALNITLAAKSAFRLNITYPDWFRPILFECKHIQENPKDFLQFFGDQGSLLYYPTAIILVRGFSVKFKSTQAWTYDYDHSFSAGGGGGFGAFGVSFGASSSYSEHTKEHQVDTSGTELNFFDDEKTIRFIGYAVAKNKSFATFLKDGTIFSLGQAVANALP